MTYTLELRELPEPAGRCVRIARAVGTHEVRLDLGTLCSPMKRCERIGPTNVTHSARQKGDRSYE